MDDISSEEFQEAGGFGGKEKEIKWSFSVFMGNMLVALRYVWSDTLKNKKSFFIGFTTVLIVVFAVALFQNTVEHSPILFLKLSEDSVGEYDIVVTPKGATQSSFLLNHTYLSERLSNVPDCAGVFSRTVMISSVLRAANRLRNGSAVLIALDSAREQGIVGREWTHKPLEGARVHASASLLRMIGVTPNNNESLISQFDLLALYYTVISPGISEYEFVDGQIRTYMHIFLSYDQRTDKLTINVDDTLGLLNRFIPGLPIEELRTLLKNPLVKPQIEQFLLAQLKASNLDVQQLIYGDANNVHITEEQYWTIKRMLTIEFEVEVMDSLPVSLGKYPDTLGNVIILENDLVNALFRNKTKALIDSLPSRLTGLGLGQQALLQVPMNAAKNAVDRFDIRESCLVVIIMYGRRLESYIKDVYGMEKDMFGFSNALAERLPLNYPVKFDSPLVVLMGVLYYLRLFLDQLLLSTEVFLLAIESYLIYSLLLAEVEDKVYDMGMLRALGMEQYTLIAVLSFMSLFFAVPAIVGGIILAHLGFMPIAYYLGWYTATSVSLVLSGRALGLAVGVGLLIPFIALILPIKRALSKTLRDALDIYHSLSSDTSVTFTYLQDVGLSPTQTALSVLAVVAGFTIYYLVPFTFFYLYLAAFFDIFILLVVAMVAGMTLLGTIVHPYLAKLIINSIMWGKDRRCLRSLVLKNNNGHARRNATTAVIYSVCIAFIIFTGTLFMHQAYDIKAQGRSNIGSDITIQSFVDEIPLNWKPMKEWLEMEKAREGSMVIDYAFCSFPIHAFTYIQSHLSVKLTNLAGYPSFPVFLMALDYNFMDVAFSEYASFSETNKNFQYNTTAQGAVDVIKSIYVDESSVGKVTLPEQILSGPMNQASVASDVEETADLYGNVYDVVISEATRSVLSIDTEQPIQLSIPVAVQENQGYKYFQTFHYMLSTRAMVRKFPAFIFSTYAESAYLTPPVFVSLKQYERMMWRNYNLSYVSKRKLPPPQPPMRALYIRCKDEATNEQREDVINSLKTWIMDSRILITSAKRLDTSLNKAVLILDLFQNTVVAIIIGLCFFMLFVSFTSNITENAWEFGVLRALGLTAPQVIRVYLYEALALVFSSIIIGFVSGSFISTTLAMEANLFSEYPFRFEFPYSVFFTVIGLSLAVTLLASYLPARVLLKKRIASALKGK